MADQHKNFARSTVAVAPSPASSGTTVTVASGEGALFPTPPFNVVFTPAGQMSLASNSEIARCTSISGDVLTIARAQEGTSARSVVVGDQIAAAVTKRWWDDIEAPLYGSRKIGSLVVLGHSYAAGATQGDAGTSNVYQESVVAKLQALMSIHEHNVIHLGQAGSTLTGIEYSSTSLFPGWKSVAQFVLPNNSAVINAALDVPITDPAISVNGAGVMIHGCNDVAAGFLGLYPEEDMTRAMLNRECYRKALEFSISRFRAGMLYAGQLVGGTPTFDSSIQFSGFAVTANPSYLSGTGACQKGTVTIGDTFTYTIPKNFTGGVIGIAVLPANYNRVARLTATYASSGGVTLTISAALSLSIADGWVIKNMRTGEEMLVSSGGTSTSIGVLVGGRAVNGTTAAAGAVGDPVMISMNTTRINWSGTCSAATGSTIYSGYGIWREGDNKLTSVPVIKRFVCTAADAGKTIIGTNASPVSGDGKMGVWLDSIWLEANEPTPVVLTNLPDIDQRPIAPGGSYYPTYEFGSGPTVTYGAASLTDTSKKWMDNELAGKVVTVGAATMTVSSNTATVITGTGNWSGGTPAAGSTYWMVAAATGDNTVIATTNTTLQDKRRTSNAALAWPTNGLVGQTIVATGGKSMQITSNTADTVTGAAWSGGGNPGNGVGYQIGATAIQPYNAPLNKVMADVVATFDSWVQIADVYSTWWKRNGTLGLVRSGVGVTTGNTQLQDTRHSNGTFAPWTTALIGQIVTCNGKTMTITGVTGGDTLTCSSWSGGGNPGNGNPYTIGTALTNADANPTTNVLFYANDSSFTPKVGQRLDMVGEAVTIAAVSGAHPNWILSLNRDGVPGWASVLQGRMVDGNNTGTATGATTGPPGTLTDSSKGWVTNQYQGRLVTAGGKTMTIASHTGTVLTGIAGWSGGGNPGNVAYTIGTALPHYLGEPINSGDWMYTDMLHLNVKGHSVFAELIFRGFDSMPFPADYQIAQVAGNWSQMSQNWSMGIIDNGYMYPLWQSATGAVQQANTNRIWFTPFWIPRMCICTQIGVACTVTASGNLRAGLWLPDNTHSRPGTLLQDFGSAALAVSDDSSVVGYQVLRPGYYWAGVAFSALSTVRTAAVSGIAYPSPPFMVTSPLANLPPLGLYADYAGGSLPLVAPATTLYTAAASPVVPRTHLRLRVPHW